jgi:signal transduction histidine kinase
MWDDRSVPATRVVLPALAAVAVPLGVVAYRVQVDNLPLPDEEAHAAAIVAVAWAFVVAGLVAWWRRPENRLGRLLVAAGFALLARQLRYSHSALLFTVFFALGELGYALVGHSVLAYPFGRLRRRPERLLVRAGYAVALAFPLVTLLVYDPRRRLPELDAFPHRSLLRISGNADLAVFLQKTFVVVFYGVLGALFIALIMWRLAQAAPRMRRTLAPLLLAAIAVALRGIFECAFTFFSRPFAYDVLFWWQIAGFIALPVALLAGLLRARLARATVGDLVVELERARPEDLRGALARALGDPTLDVAFWLPERHAFVGADGLAVELPAPGSTRAMTQLDRDGEPLAALVHDPSLLDEPRLVEAAGAAARMALENARLQAELRAQLDEVRQSRRRLVTAADDERRRLERDLHDGAQQRLLALAIQLRTAQRQLGASSDPEVDRILAAGVDELQAAVLELRELAHGVHPAVLTDEGLAAALEALASRAALPVALDVDDARMPAQVEAAAYFVVCEALANTVKHAGATSATVSARRRDGVLVVEVGDDGVGGARTDGGTGLRGLADRVEALGGRLRVESPAGGGTRVIGEIPCAS